MPFLSCCGITIPARKNSWPNRPMRVGEARARAQSGVWEETYVRRVREWRGVKIVFQEPSTAHAMRRLLEGEFHSVDFENSGYAFNGEGPAVGGSYTFPATGKHGAFKCQAASANYIGYSLANSLGVAGGWAPTKGWTLICWKTLTTADDGIGGAGTWYHHIATGSVNVTVASAANPVGVTQYRNGVAGNFNMGNWIELTSGGEVRLYGKDNAAVNKARDYDELVLLPFQLPTAVAATWAAALYAFHDANAFARAPYVKIAGDCIPDTTPLEVRVDVKAEENVNVNLNGSFYNNALELELDVLER